MFIDKTRMNSCPEELIIFIRQEKELDANIVERKEGKCYVSQGVSVQS